MAYSVVFCFILLWRGLSGCTSCSSRLENVLQQTLECRSTQLVGMSVSVARSDETLFEKGFGVLDMETNASVTENSVFGIASLSKAFASTLIVTLLEKSTKFSLDSKISTIFENNNIFIDDLRSAYTTVRDLLSHRNGIPSNNKLRLDSNLTRSNLIYRLKFLKPEGRFRESFYYNNLMFGLLTYMAEIIGGDTWETLVKKHIFDPLGMTSSSFMTKADMKHMEVARGYDNYYGDLRQVPFEFSRRYAELCGSGCVLSSAHDMAKWMKFYLNEGKLSDGSRILSKKSFKEIIRPENVIVSTYTTTYFSKPEVPVTTSISSYALGWRRGHYRGYNMVIHSGSTYGYRALISIYPDVDLAIFTVLTGDDPNYFYRQSLHNFIFDVYSNYTPWLNVSTICSYPSPWFKVEPPKSKPNIRKDRPTNRQRTAYYGIFGNPAYGDLEVKEQEEDNKLLISYGYVNFVLYPKVTPDEFYGDAVGIAANIFNLYSFNFKFQGNNITLTVPNFEPKDPPVFFLMSNGIINERPEIFCTLIVLSIFLLM